MTKLNSENNETPIYKGEITKEEFDEIVDTLYKTNKRFKRSIDELEYFNNWLKIQSPEIQKEINNIR